MRNDIDIACTSYLTLHEQKLRIKSFLIEYFGTVHFSLVETGLSITAVQEETVFSNGLMQADQTEQRKNCFFLSGRSKRNGVGIS